MIFSVIIPVLREQALINEAVARLRAIDSQPDTELHSKDHLGGDEEPTEAYSVVRRGERRGDNEDGAKKATRYKDRYGCRGCTEGGSKKAIAQEGNVFVKGSIGTNRSKEE